MTAPQFAEFTPPVEGDRYTPKDNIGHVLIVKPTEKREGVVTENSPEGTTAVAVSLVDLDDTSGTPKVYRDALLFGGALVDGLSPYVGQTLVIKLDLKTSKAGRTYPNPVKAEAADMQRASAYITANGDPFAPTLGTIDAGSASSSVTSSSPPF
jgi:hypothetical protein